MQLANEPRRIGVPPADEVRQELQRVLASDGFDASERNRRFLSYVVEETLAGRADCIKAYTIALAAFDRGDDFDPLSDPIVRIEAGRLRRSLDHYYLTKGLSDPVRIDIPKGAYVAAFTYRDTSWQEASPSTSAPPAASPSPQIERKPGVAGAGDRWRWGIVAAVAALVVLVAAYAGSEAWRHHRGPSVAESSRGPSVLVMPFQNTGGDAAQDYIARGLTFEIINLLTRYNELFIFGLETSFSAGDSAEAVRADYVLSASVQSANDKVKVSAILSESRTGQTVWSQDFERDLTTASLLEIESDIAGQLAGAIAQPYGIVFNRTAAEIVSKPAKSLKSYECVVRFRQQWRERDPRDYENLRGCLEQTIRADPDYARAYSSLALLDIDSYRFGFGKGKIAVDPLKEALELSRKSLELDPDNSEGYLSLMTTYWFMHDPGKSIETAERGLALNPHNTDLLADLGFRYAQMEQWDRSRRLIAEALARNPKTPSGYRVATFHYYYMHGDYKAALDEIMQVKTPFVLYGHIWRAMAYAQLGDKENAAAAVAEILKIDPKYGEHVEADLAKRGNSPGIIRAAVDGLSKAGLKITPQ